MGQHILRAISHSNTHIIAQSNQEIIITIDRSTSIKRVSVGFINTLFIDNRHSWHEFTIKIDEITFIQASKSIPTQSYCQIVDESTRKIICYLFAFYKNF